MIRLRTDRGNDNCKKENVAFTYHRINGFAPIFATIGRHGYQLANELRPGNQHSQKEFPGFLRRCVRLVRRFYDRRILVRIDSAHDADDTLVTGFALDDEMRASLEGNALDFIVKRNARHEDERMWIEQANGECSDRSLDALRPFVEFGEADFDYPFTSLAYTFTDSG